jgi:hypothetical protein
MTTRKFLTSVADVLAYDESDNVVFIAKTLLDSSIEVSLGSAPVRGGRGNQLQYIYYHTGEMKFNLTDTQWNLAMLASTMGSTQDSNNYYKEESVTVTGSAGSVSATPLAFITGGTIYGWATSPLGVTQRLVIGTNKAFTVTGTETSGSWCLRYYTLNATVGKKVTIKANMIPEVVKLVMETQLNSADVTTNKIGIVQIIAPRVNLSGAFTISMKADGVANTPLTGTALAYEETSSGCSSSPYYAQIIEVIDSTNWYDTVTSLAIEGGAYSMAKSTTRTVVVWAIPSTGAAFIPPVADLSFSIAEGTATGITIGAQTGIVTSATTAGTATLTCVITAATTIDATTIVTVTS